MDQNLEFGLQVSGIESNPLIVGLPYRYTLSIINRGAERFSGQLSVDLSLENVRTKQNIELQELPIGVNLKSGSGMTRRGLFNIPDLPDGDYRFKVESQRGLFESAPVFLGRPRLNADITGLSSPPAIIGREIGLKANISITNSGSIDVPNKSFNTRLFLSDDNQFSSGDKLLTWISERNGLAPSATIQRTANLRINAKIAPRSGDYWIFAKSETTNRVINSSNLVSAGYKIRIDYPDLQLTPAESTKPLIVERSESFAVGYNLMNVGTGTAVRTTIESYLSTNEIIDKEDRLIGSIAPYRIAINPNEVIKGIVNITLPTDTKSGQYKLITVINRGQSNSIEDRLENNCFISDITVKDIQYSSRDGYGAINAARLVAQSIGRSTFADVNQLGGRNWNLDLVKAPEVWDRGYKGQGITVAVIDTGVDINHPDLAANIWRNPKEVAGNGIDDDGNGFIDDVNGWNFPDRNNNVSDRNSHGTHVAGIVAALQNSIGGTGVAPSAKIMPVKVIGGDRMGTSWDVAQGIYYAVNNGARVVNISLGGASAMPSIETAINYAASKGVTVVMAAGNSGGTIPVYPGYYALNNGVVVGAVDSSNRLQGFSNRAGNNSGMVYVTAPGSGVVSTTPNGRYAGKSGTSMAAPHVAGVVALMLSANPNLTSGQIRNLIMNPSMLLN